MRRPPLASWRQITMLVLALPLLAVALNASSAAVAALRSASTGTVSLGGNFRPTGVTP